MIILEILGVWLLLGALVAIGFGRAARL